MTLERFEKGSTPSYFFQSATQKYLFASKHIKGAKILDIACGTGYGTNIMFERHPEFQFFGCDIDEQAITYAKRRYQKQIQFKNCDAYSITFPDSFFDTVVSFETLEHLKNGQSFIKEIKRILKSDGYLICSTPNRHFGERLGSTKEKPFNPHHVSLYYYDEFHDLLASSFQHVKIFGQTETGADFFYKFPAFYRFYRRIKPIILPLLTHSSSKSEIVIPEKPNPKFEPKPFWKSAYYLLAIASDMPINSKTQRTD